VNGKYTQYSLYVVKREVLTINQHITRNLTEFELMLICTFQLSWHVLESVEFFYINITYGFSQL